MADSDSSDEGGLPPPPPGLDADPAAVARYLVACKMAGLSKLIAALGDGPAGDDARDELRLCQAWANALNAGDTSNLPSAGSQQPLLDAIQKAEGMINASGAANQLIQAATTLINTMKAPG